MEEGKHAPFKMGELFHNPGEVVIPADLTEQLLSEKMVPRLPQPKRPRPPPLKCSPPRRTPGKNGKSHYPRLRPSSSPNAGAARPRQQRKNSGLLFVEAEYTAFCYLGRLKKAMPCFSLCKGRANINTASYDYNADLYLSGLILFTFGRNRWTVPFAFLSCEPC